MNSLQEMRELVNKHLGKYRHLKERITEELAARDEADQHVANVEAAQAATQVVAQAVQQKAHTKIAGIVSHCLEAVFEDPYQFRINFDKKRGKTEARLTFIRNERELDPKRQAGYGAMDVGALGLRLACLMLGHPPKRRLLVVDEPFRNLQPLARRERAQAMLWTLSKDMKIQTIMSTNIPGLETGKVIQV